MESGIRKLRLGTRASALALWQAEWVAQRLRQAGAEVELVRLTTRGDATSASLQQIGGQGAFTKEIQRALLEQQVDLAVHSLKDLPTERVGGLALAAIPVREACGDVLVAGRIGSLDELPRGARVGTGSTRRRAQLWHVRADLEISDIRGNLDTRLRKLDEGQYDALVLAEAGLRRLGWEDRISCLLPPAVMLPAVGQGALGIEAREDDEEVHRVLATLDDPTTRAAVFAERSLLATLRAGCLAPVGAWARKSGDGQLALNAVVLSGDGRQRISASALAEPEECEPLGVAVAQALLQQGAAELIQSARQ